MTERGKNLISRFNAYRDNFLQDYLSNLEVYTNAQNNDSLNQNTPAIPDKEILKVLAKLDSQAVKSAADLAMADINHSSGQEGRR